MFDRSHTSRPQMIEVLVCRVRQTCEVCPGREARRKVNKAIPNVDPEKSWRRADFQPY